MRVGGLSRPGCRGSRSEGAMMHEWCCELLLFRQPDAIMLASMNPCGNGTWHVASRLGMSRHGSGRNVSRRRRNHAKASSLVAAVD